MARTMTAYEFSNKVEWEGGILAALDYGLRAVMLATPTDDHLSADLKRAWSALEAKYDALRDDVAAVSDLLELVDDRAMQLELGTDTPHSKER